MQENSISENMDEKHLAIFMAVRAAFERVKRRMVDKRQERYARLQQLGTTAKKTDASRDAFHAAHREHKRLFRTESQELVAIYERLRRKHELFACPDVEAIWEKIRRRSGLPDAARTSIEAIIIKHRAKRALEKWRIPNELYQLHDLLPSLIPLLDALVSDPPALRFLLSLTEDRKKRWNDPDRTTAVIKAAKTLSEIYDDLNAWTEATQGSATRGPKQNRPLELVADLNECFFAYAGRPISKGKNDKDFHWIAGVCELVDRWSESQIEKAMQAVITSHGLDSLTPRYLQSRKHKKRRSSKTI